MAPTSIGSLDSPLGSVDGEVDHFSLGQGRWISWAILSLAVSLFFAFGTSGTHRTTPKMNRFTAR